MKIATTRESACLLPGNRGISISFPHAKFCELLHSANVEYLHSSLGIFAALFALLGLPDAVNQLKGI